MNILLTGASRGIGAAVARRFHAEGAQVVNASIIDPVEDRPEIDFARVDVTGLHVSRPRSVNHRRVIRLGRVRSDVMGP